MKITLTIKANARLLMRHERYKSVVFEVSEWESVIETKKQVGNCPIPNQKKKEKNYIPLKLGKNLISRMEFKIIFFMI